MSMENLTQKLSKFVSTLRYDDLGEETVEYAKILLMDYIASSAAGYRVNTSFNRAMESVYFDMGGKPESKAMFTAARYPAMTAAMINGTYVHGADLDDGNRNAMGHPGCTVISALLALGEAMGASGKDFITAMAAGYEVYARVSSAVQPSHVNRGFHSTGTVGTLAAAAACANLLRLDAEATEAAIALAIIQAGGLIIVNESGQACKPINPAKAAYSGILAAKLAKQGVRSSQNALESTKGFFHAFADAVDVGRFETLGRHLCIMDSYIKPYPACRHTHAGADAAKELRQQIGDPKQIERITVRIYPVAISLAGKIAMPRSVDEAKFSIAYAICCAMVNGSFGLDDILDPGACDPRIREMAQKVEIVCDQSYEDPKKGTRGAGVQVLLRDGRIFTKIVPLPKGDPEYALDRAGICDKLDSSAGDLLNEKQKKQITEQVFNLEKAGDMSDLILCLAPEK